jgi:hypothetical protein
MDHDPVEDFSFVHQIGKPPRSRLLLELRTGGISFLGEQLFNADAQLV